MSSARRVLRWSLEARQEARDAALWYRARAPAIAVRFSDELDLILAALREAPQRWALWRPPVRRCLFQQFPYVLCYELGDSGEVVILALLHQHQDPGRRFPP